MGRIKLDFCGICENKNQKCLTCQGRWQKGRKDGITKDNSSARTPNG